MNVKRTIIISIIFVVLISSVAAVSAGLLDGFGPGQKHEKAEIIISHGNDVSYALDLYGDVPSETQDWALKFNDSYSCYWVTSCSGYNENITRIIVANDELSPIDSDYYFESDFRPLKIKCDIMGTKPLDDSGNVVAFVENVEFVEWA